MNQLSNRHYLYLHSSIATQTQVYQYIQSLMEEFEKVLNVKLNKEFIVNTVHKYDGTPLKHSFVWFKSIQSAELFLNKDLEGKDRAEEYPDPNHDTSEEEKRFQEFMNSPTPVDARWEDLVDEEEMLYNKTIKNKIKKPQNPLIQYPGITPSSDQLEKNPDLQNIDVEFYSCKVYGKPNCSYHKLFAIHVAKDVSEAQIRKHFIPFATTKNVHEKKDYPLVHIDRKSNPHSVTISYCPGSMDAVFALCMVKKVFVQDKCTLNFDLYREN